VAEPKKKLMQTGTTLSIDEECHLDRRMWALKASRAIAASGKVNGLDSGWFLIAFVSLAIMVVPPRPRLFTFCSFLLFRFLIITERTLFSVGVPARARAFAHFSGTEFAPSVTLK
jgi:hypothetical protein